MSEDRKTLTFQSLLDGVDMVAHFLDMNPAGETATLTAWVNAWYGKVTPDPPSLEFTFSAYKKGAAVDYGVVQITTGEGLNRMYLCCNDPPYFNNEGLGYTYDGQAGITRFVMKYVAEDQIKLNSLQGSLKRLDWIPSFSPDYRDLVFPPDLAATDLVIRDYDPDAGTFKLWDPETDYMLSQLWVGGWKFALVAASEGNTFSFNYLTTKPVPPRAAPYKLVLTGDSDLLPQADGISPHTATATITRLRTAGPEFPSPVFFNLPDDGGHKARFIPRLGQTLSTDGMQLRAPVNPSTGQATVQFVDTSPNGETVALRAAIEIDPGGDDSYYIESTPIKLPFRFVRNIGATLELERDLTIFDSRLAAGGKIYQATAVASHVGALPPNAQQATFKLVEGSSASFIPGGNQTTSDNGKTLHAPLNNGQAIAQFQDANMSGELVGLRAYIETSELYVPSVPPLLDYAANLTLELKLTSNDLDTKTLADGISQHTATATLTGGTVDKGDLQVVFQLSPARGAKDGIDAWFVDETANQQVSNDGKTLTAVLVNNQASVKFVDNSMQGEEVWLQASIPNLS
ncbi:hypothetical protein BAU06_15280 [Bordetella bronchialis]|uniref:Uncharacterized protein n=1 Tax=Bordetella bronchialis TaxID=463025 RepID=A0ABM6CTT9_9BORD|nr:hypothetical protein BAU06_15280 [Bordetella bronchialis]